MIPGKLDSITALESLRARLRGERPRDAAVIVIPAGTCGRASGAEEIVAAAEEVIQEDGLADRVLLRVTGCHGWCEMEPSILVEPRRTFYPRVKPGDVPRIVAAAACGTVAEELLYSDSKTDQRIERQEDIPFYQKQVRTLLGRNERVDPTRIGDYIAEGGYGAFARALHQLAPSRIIEEIKAAGLRGRGGGGFPTGRKWEMLAAQPDGQDKYVVCNGDEGDPGAYMDRSLLEGNPHAIIEGMLIGAYATGANRGVIYVRMEYPLAIRHVAMAIEQARQIGLLGDSILGSSFSFDISLVRGAGAFVCGEETALIRSIEGEVGEPRQRPPYPVQRGIRGRPTLINNVETWANVPVIIEEGAERFARIGTPGNTGTKIFSLVGKVRNTGLVEVPMGITLAEIVYDIGGASATAVKAVQTGGPSGGCIPARMFDLRVDYDSLQAAGAIMGSGGMIVMDQGTCMVDIARYFTRFLMDESCGKCFTCRKGIQRMHEILDDITNGRGKPQDLDLLEELALAVKDTTLCGLGQTAPNPVLSTLRYFRDEYLEHIVNRRCPAGVCTALVSFAISEDCTGCGRCAKVCPTGAIAGERGRRFRIDPEKCIKCGACRDACRAGAVGVVPGPERVERKGRGCPA